MSLIDGYIFRTIIEPDDPKGYHGYVPLLQGVHTCGKTVEEVKKNLRQAIICHIEALIKSGERIPSDDESIEKIEVFSPSDFSSLNYAQTAGC